MGLNFVAIDFETANSQRGSACSVGMVRIRDGEVVAQESFLIKPHESLGDFGDFQMKIHKITPAHVEDAPGWDDGVRRISNFIQDDYVVAHNAPFDSSVMRSASDVSGVPHPNITYFCTLELTRAAIPSLDNHKLKTVAKALKLGDFKHHEAEQDALIAAMICVRIAEKVNVTSITALMKGYRVSAGKIGGGREYARWAAPLGIADEGSLDVVGDANSKRENPELSKNISERQVTVFDETKSDSQPLSRRERRQREQLENKNREERQSDALILEPDRSEHHPLKVSASKDVEKQSPVARPQNDGRPDISSYVPRNIERSDGKNTAEPKIAYNPVWVPLDSIPSFQKSTVPPPAPPAPQHYAPLNPNVEMTIHQKKGMGWKVLLLPLIPFFIFIVAAGNQNSTLMTLMFLVWIVSVPSVCVRYLYMRSKRSQMKGIPDSYYSKDNRYQQSLGRYPVSVAPYGAPALEYAPEKIGLLNARQAAKRAQERARSLENQLRATTQSLKSEQGKNRRITADYNVLDEESKELKGELSEMRSIFNKYDVDDVVKLDQHRSKLAAKVSSLKSDIKTKKSEISDAQSVLDEINLEILYDEVGLIDYEHIAESSIRLSEELEDLRHEIKLDLKYKLAYSYTDNFTFDGSSAKGTRFAENMAKTMMGAYNAESENAIKSLRSLQGVNAAKNRIQRAFERVAKNGAMIDLRITDSFHQLRIKEVDIAAKHLTAVKLNKELEKERREQEREDAREREQAEREAAIAQEKLDKERQQYVNAQIAVQSNGDEAAALRMQEKIDEIDEAIENLNNRVANTRAGHVYIISNVGAFGEGIVKIGMTRRLNPMDRVKELGDASVPFRFDTHALFFAEDAVEVENILHKHFAAQRVNRVNLRREFFYTNPHEVMEALKEHNIEVVHFAADFEAEEYRASQAIIANEKGALIATAVTPPH